MHIWDGLQNMSRLTVGFYFIVQWKFPSKPNLDDNRHAYEVKICFKIKVEPYQVAKLEANKSVTSSWKKNQKSFEKTNKNMKKKVENFKYHDEEACKSNINMLIHPLKLMITCWWFLTFSKEFFLSDKYDFPVDWV